MPGTIQPGTFQPNPALLDRFGLNSFRPGQSQVIETVLKGEDCLCIMPTGGGKSLCFQYPAVARDGLVIVISPLIALMKDQVDSLNQRNIPATYINSSLTYSEQQSRCQQMVNGCYDLVYVAPERLRNSLFLEQLSRARLQLLAIDEAHCISQWGHDFRPDYARIGRFRQRLGQIQTIALTATATATVRDDIVEVLGLSKPKVYVTGFARENLALAIAEVRSDVEKDRMLIQFLSRNPGTGIVYSSTRKGCEHIDELLRSETKRKVGYYHAGLDQQERREIQENFINGKTEIIVATNAFGMGIDKSDVRYVVHYNLPGSIEAYYQEAGRAGRDGLPSNCLMLHGYRDRFIQEFFIENSYPSTEVIETVYNYLRSIKADPIEMTLQEIKDDLDLPIGTEGIRVCENVLEKSGVLERMDVSQNMASIRITSQLPSTVDLLPREARTQRRVLRALEKIVGDLRGERVYFHVNDVAKQLNLNLESIMRAIRAINELDIIDYVPAFRGRAVHLHDRTRKFSELQIDFAELEKRKAAEYARLDQITRFAKTSECRQTAILTYFGDPDAAICSKCDNCQESGNQKSATFDPTDNGCLYATQVAISGAVRVSGRVGKNLIAQMLAGSEAKKVSQLGLNKISTFGLLGSLRLTEITSLIDKLIDARMLHQEEIQKFRPVIKPTTFGREVIKGNSFPDFGEAFGSALQKRLNRLFANKKPHLNPKTDDQPKVNESNVELNSKTTCDDHVKMEDIADSNSEWSTVSLDNIDNTTHAQPVANNDENDIELALPEDGKGDSRCDASAVQSNSDNGADEGLANVSSIGARFVEVPSETEFDTVNSETDNPALKPDSTRRLEQPKHVSFSIDNAPSYFWTWHLFEQGYDLVQVCRIRNINEDQAISDLIRSKETGMAVEMRWLAPIHSELAALAGESERGFWRRIKRLDFASVSPKLKLLMAKCVPGTQTT